MADLVADYETLTTTGGCVFLAREVLRAKGEDVLAYLHGQLTQNIEGVGLGETRWSFVLQPHGKVDGFLRLTRTAEDEFLIDVDKGQRDVVIERLQRFKMRTKVEFTPLDYEVLAVRGSNLDTPTSTDAVVVPVDFRGMTGYDLFAPHPHIPDGISEVDDEAYDALRISVGLPVMGVELDEFTIPAEAGINDLTIDFNKGCYTGQELVARIDSRGGNVPRHMRAIICDGDEHPPRGSEIHAEPERANSKPLGTLTSLAYSPKIDKFVGLALVRRDALPPCGGKVIWEDGPTACRIETLPLAP